MPVSTEVLNDDIKELKGEMQRLGVGLAELRQEVRDAIGLARWAATLLAGVLLTSGLGAVIWGARLDTKVSGMESRTAEKFQEVGIRIDAMEKRIGEKLQDADKRVDKLEARIDARFDKLEASIAKALDQLKPAIKPGP